MRPFLLVLLFSTLIYAGPADTASPAANRWAVSVNMLGPATFGLGAGAEYGLRNAVSMKVIIGNTSIPILAVLAAQDHDVSYFSGGVSVGYARYFDKVSPLEGFFLRPLAGIHYFYFNWNKADFFDTDMKEWTPPVDLFYLTLKTDIGRRWSWKNGVLMGAGISIGAAFQMDKLNLTPVEADEKDAEGWLATIPFVELILEVGYRF